VLTNLIRNLKQFSDVCNMTRKLSKKYGPKNQIRNKHNVSLEGTIVLLAHSTLDSGLSLEVSFVSVLFMVLSGY
jgi:hypothetical protein